KRCSKPATSCPCKRPQCPLRSVHSSRASSSSPKIGQLLKGRGRHGVPPSSASLSMVHSMTGSRESTQYKVRADDPGRGCEARDRDQEISNRRSEGQEKIFCFSWSPDLLFEILLVSISKLS